jgi:hypothetical protein
MLGRPNLTQSGRGAKKHGAVQQGVAEPGYSITSSALSRIDCGTVRPSALAVLAFKAISNL